MAAAHDSQGAQLVELRALRAEHLEELLREEAAVWRSKLDWDFQTSAGLIRRFLDMHALNGYALLVDGRTAGYAYYVCEEHKGLIGDLYVMDQFATADNESRLLHAVVEAFVRAPFVHRVESQLMMLRYGNAVTLPHWRNLKTYRRNFMEIDLAPFGGDAPIPDVPGITVDAWTARRQDEAAALVANAYQGHIDSEINDQYRSVAGARRFLTNIVQFPGCGIFSQTGSVVGADQRSGKLAGISLVSLISTHVGHITQICVQKALQGQGVGEMLLRRSLRGLAASGCRKASLTVTGSNDAAISLYRRLGFTKVHEFTAYVWDGF